MYFPCHKRSNRLYPRYVIEEMLGLNKRNVYVYDVSLKKIKYNKLKIN